jgi:hypothetical protein
MVHQFTEQFGLSAFDGTACDQRDLRDLVKDIFVIIRIPQPQTADIAHGFLRRGGDARVTDDDGERLPCMKVSMGLFLVK